MQGRYSEQEFFKKYDHAQYKKIRLSEGLAWIRHGYTINYYHRHPDGSWTNYDCRTSYS